MWTGENGRVAAFAKAMAAEERVEGEMGSSEGVGSEDRTSMGKLRV